jgi:hypothetical protein
MGESLKYHLYHMTPIQRGGAVYNVNNMLIVIPRYHMEGLDTKYPYGSEHHGAFI